ncbi:MAG: hypothetical protein JW790_04475 [Dehalococcoidales bacterium]|nr:hypothetical protein [Dehalococcoidales bacterium]
MERTWKPTTAGVMTIITGAMGIVGSVILFIISGALGMLGGANLSSWLEQWSGGWWGPGAIDITGAMEQFIGGATMWLTIAAIVVLVFGIIALCGGISALKRRRWGLSLGGSILSLFIMPILGILAIIFVSLGKGEFE